MPTTTIEIAGSPVSMTAANLFPARMTLRLRGYSTLTLVRSGGPLVELPDPWLGKPVVLKVGGVPVFSGDVGICSPAFTPLGWVFSYSCRDLRARGDRCAYTDDNTLMDFGSWNLEPDNQEWLAARSGRTVGQIILQALTMQANAEALSAKGIGGYVSLSPPTLPASTLADLAAMDLIPPSSVRMGGEKLLNAVESFLQAWAPNHAMQVRADGTIRFRDLRAVTEKVLKLDACDSRIEPSGLSRSVADSYQRVLVRGRSVAKPKLVSLSNGGLVEKFAWGDFDNEEAKAAWTPADFEQDQQARSTGALSVTDLTHVVVTSDPASQEWDANEWDQLTRRGSIHVWYESSPGVQQVDSARVVANTAKASGGTSSFTLDLPLDSTSYANYTLYGVSSGASFVWRRYHIVDGSIASALARKFTYAAAHIGANGDVASLTSYPVGSVAWNPFGGPVNNELSVPISFDTANGDVIFAAPTYNIAGGEPADVRVLLAVNVGELAAVAPASGFAGTSHSVEGLADTLVVTVDEWRDPANQLAMDRYAAELLDAYGDAIVEGSVVVHSLFEDALDFGVGLSVEADGYPTGWEGLNLPVLEVDVVWNSRSGSHHTTTMQVSNRRASFSAGAFLQPERRTSDGTMGMPYAFMGPAPYMGGGGYGGEAGGWSDPSAGMQDSGGGFGGGYGSDAFGMGPIPTSAKDPRSSRDPRSARDHTSPRDPTPALDPRSARDDTPAGDRPYDPGRKYDAARKFNAPKRTPVDADAMVEARHPADGEAVKETGKLKAETQANQAERVREQGRAKAQAHEMTKDAPSTQARTARESHAAEERAKIEERNAQKKARDDADAGQDWRDAP